MALALSQRSLRGGRGSRQSFCGKAPPSRVNKGDARASLPWRWTSQPAARLDAGAGPVFLRRLRKPSEQHDGIDWVTTHGFSASRVDIHYHLGLRTHDGEPGGPLSTLASSLTWLPPTRAMRPRVDSEAARLSGEVCARFHLAGSIAGHRERRPVSMAAAPTTIGDSQVLLRRTTPEGAKVKTDAQCIYSL